MPSPEELAHWRKYQAAWRRMAEESERRRKAAPSYFTHSEPPGDPCDWHAAENNEEAFAAAGLCEVWRLGLGEKTFFMRHSDIPPGFNFSGMVWRPA